MVHVATLRPETQSVDQSRMICSGLSSNCCLLPLQNHHCELQEKGTSGCRSIRTAVCMSRSTQRWTMWSWCRCGNELGQIENCSTAGVSVITDIAAWVVHDLHSPWQPQIGGSRSSKRGSISSRTCFMPQGLAAAWVWHHHLVFADCCPDLPRHPTLTLWQQQSAAMVTLRPITLQQ